MGLLESVDYPDLLRSTTDITVSQSWLFGDNADIRISDKDIRLTSFP